MSLLRLVLVLPCLPASVLAAFVAFAPPRCAANVFVVGICSVASWAGWIWQDASVAWVVWLIASGIAFISSALTNLLFVSMLKRVSGMDRIKTIQDLSAAVEASLHSEMMRHLFLEASWVDNLRAAARRY